MLEDDVMMVMVGFLNGSSELMEPSQTSFLRSISLSESDGLFKFPLNPLKVFPFCAAWAKPIHHINQANFEFELHFTFMVILELLL